MIADKFLFSRRKILHSFAVLTREIFFVSPRDHVISSVYHGKVDKKLMF